MRAGGSSLLEVMLALLLLMLGALSAVHVLGMAQAYGVAASLQQQALALAEDKLEQLRAVPPAPDACGAGSPLPPDTGEDSLSMGNEVFRRTWQRASLCNPERWQLSVTVHWEGAAGAAGVRLDAEHFPLRVQ